MSRASRLPWSLRALACVRSALASSALLQTAARARGGQEGRELARMARAHRAYLQRLVERLSRRLCRTCRTHPARTVRFVAGDGRPVVQRSACCLSCQRSAFAGLAA